MSEHRCWVARFLDVSTPCDGELVQAHLIPKQRIKRAFPHGAFRPEGAALWQAVPRGADLRELAPAGAFMPLEGIVWDERVWVPVCGGPTGIGGHHGMLDYSRTVRIPWAALPDGLLAFAREHGLMWSLELDYGDAPRSERGPTPERFREDNEPEPSVRIGGQRYDPMDVPSRSELEGL